MTQPNQDIIAEAEAALRCFGADLDLASAARLLPMWSGFGRLTAHERVLVLRRFSPVAAEVDTTAPDALDALERIAYRLTHAEEARRKAYANGYTDALDGREPQHEVTR